MKESFTEHNRCCRGGGRGTVATVLGGQGTVAAVCGGQGTAAAVGGGQGTAEVGGQGTDAVEGGGQGIAAGAGRAGYRIFCMWVIIDCTMREGLYLGESHCLHL